MKAKAISIVLALALISCVSGSKGEKFESALTEGNFTQAEIVLKEMSSDEGKYRYAQILIDEYLSLEELDKAIYVYEHITPSHCSRYELQYSTMHVSDGYEVSVTEKLRKALIRADRFDDAWRYYPLDFDNENYAGNGSSYSRYMSDVIVYLCGKDRKHEAQMFLNNNIHWFMNNVDNGQHGEKYLQFSYLNMKTQFQEIINTY